MTVKRKARKIGKAIRQATGIDFLLAMEAGKKIARDAGNKLTSDQKFKEVLKLQRRCQGLDEDCNCANRWVLKGPTGEFYI